jgi:hypothetical protein
MKMYHELRGIINSNCMEVKNKNIRIIIITPSLLLALYFGMLEYCSDGPFLVLAQVGELSSPAFWLI